MAEIKLSVSIGEAIDKLTILEIKLDKIKDERRNDVQLEYDYLITEMENSMKRFEYYYKFLKDVNLKIWDLQDEIRSNNSYISSKCEEILYLNDARFTIKNKINKLSNSKFKEQKGYAKRVCYILTDLNNLSDLDNFDELTKPRLAEKLYYIDAFYDESVILCNNEVALDLTVQNWTPELIDKIINNEKVDFYNFTNLVYNSKVSHPYLKKRDFKNLNKSISFELNDFAY